jgi:hypothetical protein
MPFIFLPRLLLFIVNKSKSHAIGEDLPIVFVTDETLTGNQ